MKASPESVKAVLHSALYEAYAAALSEWPRLRKEAYDALVSTYVYPTRWEQVAVSCLSFFFMMLVICLAVEVNNPHFNRPGRWAQIRSEIAESFPACVFSTSASLAHLRYVYPLRWGFRAPVFPSSLGQFAFECVYWMMCFEVFVYALHRFLHWRKPIDVYKWVHRQHHLFFFPSAFAAQAIHPVEAVLFAETSLIASVFVFPISVATQYVCGVLLLIWSILAHDSQFVLDLGAHYEHHSHPHTNFGFLGFVDVLMQTVWWGKAYNGQPHPRYMERMRKIHIFLFGKEPAVARDMLKGYDAELEAKIQAEASQWKEE